MSIASLDRRTNIIVDGEWRTWLVIIGVYSSWFGWLALYQFIGPAAAVVLVFICTLHSSTQHELLHGHPTSSVALNSILAYPPLALFYPYFYYRESHLAHHNNEHLTIPGLDPESYYVLKSDWAKHGVIFHYSHYFYKTAFGRLLFGPAHSLVLLVRELLRDFVALKTARIRNWLTHLLLVFVTLQIVTLYFEVPLWHYLLIAYCATSLALIRSFFEHRAVINGAHRSVIVETGYFFRLLFLNNNYHHVHHKYPKLPWYRLASMYQSNREEILSENGGFLVKGYSCWLIGHLFKPVDSPIHPFAVTKENSD